MNALLAIIGLSPVLALPRFVRRHDVVSIAFVLWAVWHALLPGAISTRGFWSGETYDQNKAMVYLLFWAEIVGVVVLLRTRWAPQLRFLSIEYLQPRLTKTIAIAVAGLCAGMIGIWIVQVGWQGYINGHDLTCGECVAEVNLQALFLRGMPRVVLWLWLVYWATIDRRSWKRVAIAVAVGIVLFPPFGTARYMSLGFNLALALLYFRSSTRALGWVCLLYPLILYGVIGWFTDARIGPRDDVLSYISAPDFSEFETFAISVEHHTDIEHSGNILFSGLSVLPRSIYPGKWPGTGVAFYNAGDIFFPNVGFSVFAEAYLDFGIIGFIAGPLLIFLMLRALRGLLAVFVGLVPILMRGSLMGFSSVLLTIYVICIVMAIVYLFRDTQDAAPRLRRRTARSRINWSMARKH